MKINMTDKYTTRSGLPVRVLCVDRAGEMPVLALVYHKCIDELWSYTADGMYYPSGLPTEFDLIPVPKVKTPQEQVEECLAIARADKNREWFTGMPPKVGWYPANLLSSSTHVDWVAYWSGAKWSWIVEIRSIYLGYTIDYHEFEAIKWTTPWWPEEWNQEYWSKQ